MASHITKFRYGVLPIIGLTLSIFLAEGLRVVDDGQNEIPQISNDLEEVVSEFKSYFSEAIALTKRVHSDIQNLKGEIEMVKSIIEDHHEFANSSYLELKRYILTHSFQTHRVRRPSFLPPARSTTRSTIQPQQPGRGDCPVGFRYSVVGFPKCYAPLTERVDWGTAQERCRQLHVNAQLAVINSSREEQIISNIVQPLSCTGSNKFPNDSESHGVNAFWIGARRREISNCNSTMEWTSNKGTTSSILYSNWAPEEPNCARNTEACASINKYYFNKWNDLMCTWSVCPLCEVTIDS